MSPISNFVAIVATLGALASSVQAVPVVESRSLSGTVSTFMTSRGRILLTCSRQATWFEG